MLAKVSKITFLSSIQPSPTVALIISYSSVALYAVTVDFVADFIK